MRVFFFFCRLSIYLQAILFRFSKRRTFSETILILIGALEEKTFFFFIFVVVFFITEDKNVGKTSKYTPMVFFFKFCIISFCRNSVENYRGDLKFSRNINNIRLFETWSNFQNILAVFELIMDVLSGFRILWTKLFWPNENARKLNTEFAIISCTWNQKNPR